MSKYINTTGYLNDSPHRFNPFNIIESKNITMNNVNIPLLLRPNKGKARIAMPNSGEYRFPKADFVVETPLFQPGGSFYDKRGVNVNIKNILQSYLKSEAPTYSTNDCPEGYVKDAGGNCVEDVGYNPSQFLQKGMPIIPTKNDSGQIIGGTGATPQPFHTDSPIDKENISNGGMELKRRFGTPNIPAIIGTNLLSYGLATVANNIEQGRQKAFMMKQMNDPLFNGSYSFAQNDYGVDPYEQTGQLRPTYQQGGRTPITVTNPNDPRLRAYNDSLNLYNSNDGKQVKDFFGSFKRLNFPSQQFTDDGKMFYKKPVQPVVYQKSQQSKPYNINQIVDPKDLQKLKNHLKVAKSGVQTAEDEEMIKLFRKYKVPSIVTKNQYGLKDEKWEFTEEFLKNLEKKSIPQLQEPKFKVPIRIPTNRPDLKGLPFNPNISKPNMQRSEYDNSKPTNWSFTYPTGPYNQQKTLYFPDKNMWKNFIEKQKKVSSQQTENSGTATGYMQIGGNFNPIDYLYGDDETKETKETKEEIKTEAKKKKTRITEEDVDQLSLLGLSIEDILNSTNPSMSLLKRKNLSSSKGFRSFSTYKEGRNALENQLNLYKTGKTKVGLKPDSTLLEAMSKYAPFGDGNNNPIAYAEFIAKKAGVNTNTPISQIDTKKWADAIEKVEGNKKGNNPGNLRAFEKGGTYSVDFNTMMNLKKKGIKFKIVE